MKINPLNKSKKKAIVEQISYMGVKKIPHLLVKTGQERLRAFSGSLSLEEIWDLWRVVPMEGIGLYLGKEFISRSGVKKTRLSLDALHLFKDQIDNAILDLEDSQVDDWFRGKDLELTKGQIEEMKDFSEVFVAVRYKGDFVGTGNISQDGTRVFTFLPKERRRKD